MQSCGEGILTDGELEDLMSVDVDDGFLETAVRENKFDAALSHNMLQSVCDHFVRTFICENDGVATLHQLIQGCDTSLAEIEHILQNFIIKLEIIQKDIGDVRERMRSVGLRLRNARVSERVLWGFVSRFVVPPEMVRVIVQSDDEKLGSQFKLNMEKLLQLLRYRKSGSFHIAEDATPIALSECCFYAETLELLDRLAVHACLKVKRFLSRKLRLLSIKNTNISIQQDHILKPYTFYVHFLRSVAPLLRHTNLEGGKDTGPSALLPFRIVSALYDELRHEYCNVMSQLFLSRIRNYVMALNSMEKPPAKLRGGGAGGGTARMCLPPILIDTRESIPLSCYQLGERADILHHVMSPPLVPTVEKAKCRTHGYEETFRSLILLLCDAVTHEFIFTFMFFSGDMSVFVDVFKPTVQFIVDYVSEVVLGQDDGGVNHTPRGEFSQFSVFARCKDDCYGLLLLIRLCHEFRFLMKDVRRLSCLEGFFDSLLLLLWPAFQRIFEWQMHSLRSVDIARLAQMTIHHQKSSSKNSPCNWVLFIHPLVKRFAEFTNGVMTISSGCTLERVVDNSREPLFLKVVEGDVGTRSLSDTDGGCDDSSGGVALGNKNKNKQQGDDAEDLDFVELQRLAWQAIEMERASDAAESTSRLAVLEGNLLFMRVEVLRLLDEIAHYLAATTTSGLPSEVQKQHALAFLLNNVHHILCVWRESLEFSRTTAFSENFHALEELEKLHRTELVELIVRGQFPSVHNVIQRRDASECDPTEVFAAAELYMNTWKHGLEDTCNAVRIMVSSPTLESEVLVQVCMEVLLCNTRFQACVSSAVEAAARDTDGGSGEQRPLRSLIVTNQQMLQHMRTLATMPPDSDETDM